MAFKDLHTRMAPTTTRSSSGPMPTLPLQCSNCNLTFTIQPDNKTTTYFIHQYGQIDKVQGQVFELDCPLCTGIMEKIVKKDP